MGPTTITDAQILELVLTLDPWYRSCLKEGARRISIAIGDGQAHVNYVTGEKGRKGMSQRFTFPEKLYHQAKAILEMGIV